MKLQINSGGSERSIDLDPTRSYSIGRRSGDILLESDQNCSTPHATLSFQNAQWRIVDEMSTNGTSVDGQVVNFADLKPGSKISIGSSQLTLQLAQAPTPIAPAPAPMAPASARPVAKRPKQARPAPASAAARPPKGSPAAPPGVAKKDNTLVFAGAGIVALIAIVLVGMSMGGNTEHVDTTPQVQIPQQKDRNAERLIALEAEVEAALAIEDAEFQISQIDEILPKLKNTPQEVQFLNRLQSNRQYALEKFGRECDQKVVKPALKDAVKHEKAAHYLAALSALHEMEEEVRANGPLWASALATTNWEKRLEVTREPIAAANARFIKMESDSADEWEALGDWTDAVVHLERIKAKGWLEPDALRALNNRIESLKGRKLEVYAGKDWSFLKRNKAGENGNEARETKPVVDTGPIPTTLERDAEFLIPFIRTLVKVLQPMAESGRTHLRIEGRRWKLRGAELAGLQLSRKGGKETMNLKWASVSASFMAKIVKRVGFENTLASQIGYVLWAWEAGESDLASRILAEIAESQPEHKTLLDQFVAIHKEESIPDGGYIVFEGHLISPDRKDHTLLLRKIEKLVDTFARGAAKKEKLLLRKKSDAAFDELLQLGETAVKPTVEALVALREKEMEKAEKSTGLGSRDAGKLKELYAELVKRRKHALELIFDEKKWPYPYGPDNAKVTQEVMERIARVREVWDNPAQALGRKNSKINEVIALLQSLNEKLLRIDPVGQHHKGSIEDDIAYVSSIANKALSVRNFAPNKSDKLKLAGWDALMAENAAKRKEFFGKEGCPDDEAWEQLKVTNEYRVMMGVQPMKMNFKLFWAAKHHSRWCVEHNGGQISHDSPGGPRGNNVPQRCSYEGYSGGTGENIHMNGMGPTALSAHNSWLSSSGHHRNILNPNWTVMGNGRFRTIWTQNFGNSDEGEKNYESRGGK